MARVRPTLRSLAAEAGVSPMTVSLALRNSRDVSAATRARLQRLAAARGYRPDPTIAKLMHHLRARAPLRLQASLCGLTQGWAGTDLGPDNYLARLTRGLRERARALGYAFSLLDVDEYPTPAQLQRVLGSRGIDGLVLLPLGRPHDLTWRLDWRAFATVAVTPSVIAPRFHAVMPNHFDNMLRVCGELTGAGCRRIGLALTREWDERVNHRWTGGMAWQNQFGGMGAVAPLIVARPGPSLTVAELSAWLVRERPDAVICETLDRAALSAAIDALPAARRPVVATLNWPSPPATVGVDQQVERIGEVAVEVLAGMIARGEKGVPERPNTTMIEGVWRTDRTPPKTAGRDEGGPARASGPKAKRGPRAAHPG